MIIYKATSNINGKVYIGQTVGALALRKRKHIERAKRGEGHYFHNALRKHGEDNFYWLQLNKCDDIDALNKLEEYYISYYESMDNTNGYNLESGGMNFTRSEETCKKISESKKGKIRPKMSQETKDKIGFANSGEKNGMYGMGEDKNPMYGVRFYGTSNHNFGNKWTQEQKDAQSIMAKNRYAKKKLQNLVNVLKRVS